MSSNLPKSRFLWLLALIERLKEQDKKKIILSLRWRVIIVTSHLVLLGKGKITEVEFPCRIRSRNNFHYSARRDTHGTEHFSR